MNKYLLCFIFLLACFGPITNVKAHVALDYPVGGEVWIQGEDVTITWHIVAAHETINWDLYFSSDGGNNWDPIMLNIHKDSLSFNWVVPFIETSTARVRVVQDNVGQDYLDISMDFTILPNTSAPILDAPASDITIVCDGNQQAALQAWLSNNGGAVATNYCGQLVWTNDYFALNQTCGPAGNAWVTFTATDNCGSTYTIAQVNVVDDAPPVMDIQPISIVLECDGQGNALELNQWLNANGGAQATDICGDVAWSNDFSGLSNDCAANGSAVVTFSVTDECGNGISVTATVTITDTRAPEILSPSQGLTLECGMPNQASIQNWLNSHGGAQAADECGNVSWTNNYTSLEAVCGQSGYAIVTFTATDECGNGATTQAQLTISDQTAPVILSPAQDTSILCATAGVESIVQSWIDRQGGAVAVESCGNMSWNTQLPSIDFACDTTKSYAAVFTATDECGNSSITSANLTLELSKVDDGINFVDPGKTWTEGYDGFTGTWSFRFRFDSVPVMLDGKTYYPLMRAYDPFSANWEQHGALMRWEDGRVYQHATVGEFILYDFTLNVGDTISLGFPVEYWVEETDTIIFLDGTAARRLLLEAINPAEQDSSVNHVYWVDGIGNMNGLFTNYIPWSADWDHSSVLCMFINDTLIYDDPDIDSCWIMSTSTSNPDDQDFLIYPNPTSGALMVPEGAEDILVYSVLGEELFFRKIGNEVILQNVADGIYFLVCEFEGKRRMGRVVVCH